MRKLGTVPRHFLLLNAMAVQKKMRDAPKARLAAKAVSLDQSSSMVDALSRKPNLIWAVLLETPFSLDGSKNRRWSNNRKGHVYLTKSVRSYSDALALQVKNAVRNMNIVQAKVWISIFVQKPDHRSDAINFVDTICDAIKVAIDLDDRWFSLDRVDWEVCKLDPKIYIKIGQESDSGMICCSYCGGIKTFDHFTKNRSSKTGYGRVCRDCRKL